MWSHLGLVLEDVKGENGLRVSARVKWDSTKAEELIEDFSNIRIEHWDEEESTGTGRGTRATRNGTANGVNSGTSNTASTGNTRASSLRLPNNDNITSRSTSRSTTGGATTRDQDNETIVDAQTQELLANVQQELEATRDELANAKDELAKAKEATKEAESSAKANDLLLDAAVKQRDQAKEDAHQAKEDARATKDKSEKQILAALNKSVNNKRIAARMVRPDEKEAAEAAAQKLADLQLLHDNLAASLDDAKQ